MTVVTDATPLISVTASDVEKRVAPQLALEAARDAALSVLEPDTEIGRLTLPMGGGWIRIMGAVVPSKGVFGYKEFHLTSNSTVRYAVHLFAIDDGRPLGVVDGSLLTPLRTAATATLAAVCFLQGVSSPLDVGVIGSGTEARAGLRSLADALPVGSARVLSRRPENRRRFAKDMSDELGISVQPADHSEALVDGADVVYVATNSGGVVVVEDADLGEVPLVLSIGSTIPAQRELAADVLTSASLVVVDTPEVLEESGDVLAAEATEFDRGKVVLLGELLRSGPRQVSGRTVYKSIGSPEQDVILAAAILDLARSDGFGRSLPALSAVKRNL